MWLLNGLTQEAGAMTAWAAAAVVLCRAVDLHEIGGLTLASTRRNKRVKSLFGRAEESKKESDRLTGCRPVDRCRTSASKDKHDTSS